jgi:hypothetical protein
MKTRLSHIILYIKALNLINFSTIGFYACFCSCSESENKTNAHMGEYIYRLHDEYLFTLTAPEKKRSPKYPWEEETVNNLPKITKEFFRCKGSHLNSDRSFKKNDKTIKISDCGGLEKHSLPLRDSREFIYPILLKLLNYLQVKTGKRVVITSGHRCPEHNTYVDDSLSNSYSKHMIGAEVSFYVQGLENQPENVVECLLSYYRENDNYKEKLEFIEFKRHEKGDCNVTTFPWYNKEVFIKLFKPHEGRNLDNPHLYPYLSIQVRYDVDREERVVYSWEQANQNYLRK